MHFVRFACMCQFRIFNHNNPLPHFCSFPKIENDFLAFVNYPSETFTMLCLCTISRSFPSCSSCLHNIFQHKYSGKYVHTRGVQTCAQVCANVRTGCCIALHVQFGPKLPTVNIEVFPPQEAGTKSSIWRDVNKCQKYMSSSLILQPLKQLLACQINANLPVASISVP